MEDNNQLPLLEQPTTHKAISHNILARVFFWWVFPLLRRANKETLEAHMISDLDGAETGEQLFSRFHEKFLEHQTSPYAIYKAIWSTFKKQIFITYLVLLCCSLTGMYLPILINRTILFIQREDRTLIQGILLLGEIVIIRLLNTLFGQNGAYLVRKSGTDQLTAVQMFMMHKTLNVSFLSNKAYKSGEIINLMQVDAQRILALNQALSQLFTTPIELAISIYLLFAFIGVSFLVGLGVMLLTVVLNVSITRIVMGVQKLLMKAKDKRTKQAHEIFQNIKFIKVNAYEQYFKTKLFNLRAIEERLLKKRYLISCVSIFTIQLSPQLILNATLAAYVFIENTLNPADTFAIIGLFQVLQGSLSQLPSAINQLIEATISIKRLQKYFLTNELQLGCMGIGDEAVTIQSGTMYWTSTEVSEPIETMSQVQPLINAQPILRDINLTIRQGEVIAIVGDVGAGKSSILQALLGEMLYDENAQPSIQLNGRLAYVSQKSWIQNATLKDNILFGLPYDEQRYREALQYSCLEHDMKILDNQDKTMIGEKGINLSGGQKARVSLARALYSKADIYLLDDPISAVDVHVGKQIMEQCVLEYLSGKTVILITHALNYCQYASRILLMEGGSIVEEGDFNTIKESPKFQQVYSKFCTSDQNNEEEDDEPAQLILKKQQSSLKKTVGNDYLDELMMQEDRQKGDVSPQVIKTYIDMNGGILFIGGLLLVTALQTGCRLGSLVWLAHWTSQDDLSQSENISYMEIMSLLSLGFAIFILFRVITVVIKCQNTSSKIHKQMIDALMLAPICQFFERIPLGVLMNRLTKDQTVLDSEIYWSISLLYITFFNFLGNIILNIYSSTLFIMIPVAAFFGVTWMIKRFFMAANRELYRLESISKSPILSYFSETVTGLSIIRAFGKQQQFLSKHAYHIDMNRKVQLSQLSTNIWFSTTLTFLSYTVNITAIAYALFSSGNPALAGLLMTTASNIDVSLRNFLYNLAQVETQLISFERCYSFTKIQPEVGHKAINYLVKWPFEGVIQVRDLQVKYRENLSPALKGLTVNIASQQKIGVVGRTGAGKSTITLSLLRILEASQGQIIIDGVDISTLNLQQVRESITMILQDPVLFEGTLRDNLDPLQQHSDVDIKQVADQCCLGELLSQRDGLQTEVHESGDNLSAGERQLLAIARAVLKRTPIVLIDEATANIDIDTEQKIQNTIYTAFTKSTVITIAHRINTILHSDKILVIDQGMAKEFDDPKVLLEDKSSLFYSIYQETLRNNKQK